MRNFILFAVLLYVSFLLSFKEENPEPESFAKIIKDHPERMQELLEIAASYQDTGKNSEKFLSNEDILSNEQLKYFRHRFWGGAGPVIVIATLALNELIRNHLSEGDSVVFYLGKYRRKDPTRIERYNERNSIPFVGKSTYTFKDLRHKPAFAMQVFGKVPETENLKNSSGIFYPGNIIGTKGKGNHDLENSPENQSNFMPPRGPVTPAYEISRLCPPPREGCYKNS
jgi:hypothetical protein